MKSNENLQLVGLNLPPGQRSRAAVDFVELPDGTRISLPVVLINGMRRGPRLYLGAGIHGDEATGIAILSEVLRSIDATQLSGSIVCVPVQHPLSFQADHRLPLAQFLKSPLDQAPADAWTCFPGIADGNMAQLLAHRLFSLICECDYAIDIHTPTRGARYVPIAIVPHPDDDVDGRVDKLARAMGTGWIMRTKDGFYVSKGILCVEATRAGIPALTFEIGEGGRLEPETVQAGATCIRNAMQSLGMFEFARKEPARTHLMRNFVGLRSHRGGLLYNAVQLGQRVAAGDLLCKVVDIFGEDVERFVAPEAGFVVRTTTLSTVSTGDRVITLGVE